MYKEKEKEKFKEWDGLVDENIKEWQKDYISRINKEKFWDVPLTDFVAYKMFVHEFKDGIEMAISEYKKDSGEDYVDYDSFSYAFYENTMEDYRNGSLQKTLNEGGLA